MKTTLAAFLLALHLLLRAAGAATGFQTEMVTLYQPDEVLHTRLSNVENLADYIKQLQKVCAEFFATTAQAESLDIVVAVKPGKVARVWFISSTRADDKALAPLRQKLEAVPAVEVFSGPIAFSISAQIAGGDGKSSRQVKNAGPPIPKEWRDAVKDTKSPVRVPDGFLAVVWPDAPGTSDDAPAPPGFVNQVLEPTGGRIFRPKDWFYVEGHRGPIYMWTISREDSSDNHPYTTGVRIQLFSGVKKGAGKTPKEFIADFVAGKKKEAAKVINSCEPKDQGLFTRMCLETEEGPYHILYSLFWDDKMDLAVISISGTSKELWGTFAPIFDRMSEFQLIDMKRFQPAVEVNPPMTRIESRQISATIPADSFAAKPKVMVRAGTTYFRLEEQPDPAHNLQQLILVHEPDIWICNLLTHDGQHVLDAGPTYVAHARILEGEKAPTAFSTFEFGTEARFFLDHHAAALPAQTLDGQPCDVSEFKDGPFWVLLFLRADTHQPFHLDVFKDDKPDFSIRYLNYQTDLPFDGTLFKPPEGLTITEEKSKGDT